MPLQIIRHDITKLKCDAIVNAANSSLLGGGGVDGAIHAAAGRELLEECKTLGGCETGQAKITKGYKLPARYVIHTVGPIYNDGKHGEEELLRSCYRNSLLLAEQSGCESIAFPLISSGLYGYPGDQAIRVATDEISAFLSSHDMLVYIVVFDKSSFEISQNLYSGIESFIDENYVGLDEQLSWGRRRILEQRHLELENSYPPVDASICDSGLSINRKEPLTRSRITPSESASRRGLEDVIITMDESFSKTLLRLIDERGLKDPEVYRKANIDRKLFSKIRSDMQYKPSKPTALALAIALELPLDQTKDLLKKAGFALSHSSLFDIIVEYFISEGIYDIFKINEALFKYDQKLLGC